eukprot:1160429-Pelagomonas_calceolata.AAC.15
MPMCFFSVLPPAFNFLDFTGERSQVVTARKKEYDASVFGKRATELTWELGHCTYMGRTPKPS